MTSSAIEPAPEVCLVLPTYNEAPNLEPLVAAIRRELRPPWRILVVDDASPDGTGQIADRLAAADEAISVLHRRRKDGLGPAYVAGFRHALESGARLVAQMDADFSHDPADLERLVRAAEAGADVVLGSRYVAGGGVEGWSPLRRAVSRAGCAYARTVLGLPVHDLTGGLKVFRRGVLEAIDPESVAALGYAFQVEITYRATRAGFRVVELPIVFRDRRAGQSKMTTQIVAEAAWRVPAMRLADPPLRRPR